MTTCRNTSCTYKEYYFNQEFLTRKGVTSIYEIQYKSSSRKSEMIGFRT